MYYLSERGRGLLGERERAEFFFVCLFCFVCFVFVCLLQNLGSQTRSKQAATRSNASRSAAATKSRLASRKLTVRSRGIRATTRGNQKKKERRATNPNNMKQSVCVKSAADSSADFFRAHPTAHDCRTHTPNDEVIAGKGQHNEGRNTLTRQEKFFMENCCSSALTSLLPSQLFFVQVSSLQPSQAHQKKKKPFRNLPMLRLL